MIGGYRNIVELQLGAERILAAKAIDPATQAVLAIDILHKVTGQLVRQIWPTEADYQREFKAFVLACKATGRPAPEANALVMAWAVRQLGEVEVVPS